MESLSTEIDDDYFINSSDFSLFEEVHMLLLGENRSNVTLPKEEDSTEEELDFAKANRNVVIDRNVVINDKFWPGLSYNEASDWEMGRLVNPRDVTPPLYGEVENDCETDDFEIEHESISIKQENETPIKKEVQSIESNILTPPRSPENGECSKTEIFSTDYLEEQAQPKQSGMTPPLSSEGTDIAQCLAEFIEGSELVFEELPIKDEPLIKKEEEEEDEEDCDDDDDNDVDDEEEYIAEQRMQQLYRMQEESNSSEEWIKSRERSIARPINPTENDHSYYKGLHSEETAYEYYFTPSESEDSEVDVVSLPSLQQQKREQQYLMQLQQQALPQLQQLALSQQALPKQQEEKPQRRLPRRRQRRQRQSTPTAQVQPVRQVRQRGRKPAAKGKSSVPNKVSPAPREVSPAESSGNSSEEPSIPTEGKVTRGGTKRKAANKSSGSATKRRRGRAGDRDMMPAEKREQHNLMERQRRISLQTSYRKLRDQIPEIKHLEKTSKAKTLNTCIRYIKELELLSESLEKNREAAERRQLELIAKRDSLVHTLKKRGLLQSATSKATSSLFTPPFVSSQRLF